MQKLFGLSRRIPFRAPVLAAALGILLVLASMVLSSHRLFVFFNLEGLFIVVGGVLAVAFMSFEANDVRAALDAIARMLKEPKMTDENLHRDMTAIIYCARLVKDKGMRNLRSIVSRSGIADPFRQIRSQYGVERIFARRRTRDDGNRRRCLLRARPCAG